MTVSFFFLLLKLSSLIELDSEADHAGRTAHHDTQRVEPALW